MRLVTQQRTGVAAPQFITVIAFHVDRVAPQIALSDQFAEPHGGMSELGIVAHGQFQTAFFGEADQIHGLGGVDRKRFLQINVTSMFQALAGQFKMTLRRSRDMHHIGPGLVQHFFDIAKTRLDRKTLKELAGHQWFAIADADHFATADMLKQVGMRVGNLAATDDGYFKHNSLGKVEMKNKSRKQKTQSKNRKLKCGNLK